MTSSYTTRNRYLKQGTGDNTNTWGDLQGSGDFDLIDFSVDGWTTKALSANWTPSSANGTTDEARARVLKLTTATATWITTLPAVEKNYVIWNATTAAQTITSSGGGTSISVPAGGIVHAITDGTDVKQLGYSGYGLKDYIDTAILATTGSLPAVTGNDGKFIYCTAGAWTPTTFSAAASVVRTGTSTSAALTPGDTYNAFAEVTLTSASNHIANDMANYINAVHTMTENTTLDNPSNPKVGQSGFIRIIQHASSAKTLAVGSSWKRVGGALAISTTLGGTDILVYQVITSTLILYDILRNPS